MPFSQLIYNKMVEAGEVSITPHFCNCKKCKGEEPWELDFE